MSEARLPIEIARCAQLLAACIANGDKFGAFVIDQQIAAANKAMVEGDGDAIVAAYVALKEFK